MIISLAGHQGAGKSTVGKMLADALGYCRYSTGDFFRELARERGMTLLEFNQSIEHDGGETDRIVDDRQRAMGENEDNFIIDGRLAFHFIPHSFKIFLSVNARVGVERLFHDRENLTRAGIDEHETIEEAIRDTEARRLSESKRYLEYYGIDNLDTSHFDLVVDTSHKTPEEVFAEIMTALPKSA
ncbi:MAG TPA: cytidylate kinase family protein [bacterium]|nr:cytidylate kinase family protein [bacterium]